MNSDTGSRDTTTERTEDVIAHNARAWDALAKQQASLTQPASDAEFANPLAVVDPLGWLGSSITGQRLLCLAAGGGRQSALYAAAGAEVTVVDISSEMLARDRLVATARKLPVRAVLTSMDDLSMFRDAEFDIVIQPVSSCYLPQIVPVYQQVARVVRPGGLYVSQHKSPTSLQTELRPASAGYVLTEPYYRSGALPASQPCRLREVGTREYLHRWEELIGGLCRSGFLVEDLIEPYHVDEHADRGTFGHRARYVAPYLRIKARRTDEAHRHPGPQLTIASHG